MGETLYDTLNLEKTAKPEEIKKSYVELVKRYHPDKAGNDEEKQQEYNEKLLAIMSAYEILSDPEKKAEYDAELGDSTVEIKPSSHGKKVSGLNKGADIEVNHPVSMVIAAYGKGKVSPFMVAGERVILKIYPGVRRYRLEGLGVPTENGKKRGDLYVNLKIIPEENWEIEESTNNLIHKMQIPSKIAENGGTLPLTLLFKKTIKITVPAGIKNGERFIPQECKTLGVQSPKKKGSIVIETEVVEKKGLFGFLKK